MQESPITQYTATNFSALRWISVLSYTNKKEAVSN